MRVTQGKQETWEHAKECGLDEGITKIAQYFDIADVSIIGNGRMTYVNERPRKVHRVPAVPSRIDWTEVVNETKNQKTKYYGGCK